MSRLLNLRQFIISSWLVERRSVLPGHPEYYYGTGTHEVRICETTELISEDNLQKRINYFNWEMPSNHKYEIMDEHGNIYEGPFDDIDFILNN